MSSRLFNFALGLYIPPGFVNIRWGMFLVFGAMCFLAAIQFWFTYPETCGKSLEEIEFLFSPAGPKPWQTKPGQSRLDVLVAEAREKGRVIDSATAEKVDLDDAYRRASNASKIIAEKV